jgi:hypothetical protein
MKLRKLKSPFWSLFAVALLLTLPFPSSAAEPHRGGPSGGHGPSPSASGYHGPSAYHGGGGFSSGSFRGVAPGVAQGPRGGAVVRGPRGGAVAEGPRGGVAVRGPSGGVAVRGPRGAYYVGYPGGAYGEAWAPYYGPDYGPDYGEGGLAAFIAGLVIGTVLQALPPGAVAQIIGGQTYYYDGSNYYQPCYQGTDLGYCVVPNPYGQ